MQPYCLPILLVFALMLAACATPRRCARRYPPVLTQREVYSRDTLIRTRPAALDTTLGPPASPARPDTLRLAQDRLRLQIIRHTDTLRIRASCLPETLRIPITREVLRYQPGPSPPRTPLPRFPGWMWALGAAVVTALVARLLR